MRYVEPRFRALYSAMLAAFIMFGGTVTVIGATLPKLLADFRWSYVATGLVLSANSVGYFVAAFAAGLLLERLGPKRVLLVALALQLIGLLFFAASPLVVVNLLLNLLIGVGNGGLEVAINYSVVRMERHGQSRLMNFMHAAFTVGAIIAPVIAAWFIGGGGSWQATYRIMALGALAMAAVFALLSFANLLHKDDGPGAKPKLLALLRHPLLVLSFVMLAVYVGAEIGVSSWVGVYFVRLLGTTDATGAWMVSVFWLGLLAGRLGLSLVYHGSRPAEPMLALAVTCFVSLYFAMMMRAPWLAATGIFLAGLGYSAIYPMVIALVGKHFKRGQGVAVGFVSMGGGVGSFSFPFAMAALSERFGLWNGFLFFLAANLVMVGLAVMMIRRTRRLDRAGAAQL